ncbi:TetR/AcrR family transcriptional regulator [Croceicoccus mobilis]|uniref:TetR family transcriptional regulator n=1 Tax=Croceicoccus mobilis TaxID=1703339 RepID=A0A916Z093_9SPHN|nr:TetR/AcrR family transcriptional regulator [Croceicoccus mobilis]GGD69796.1 TetR family transcriptional regulator [Croceicoccus mobilis]
MSASPSPFRSAKQREADRQAKKQALLEAAVRMFNTRGYHATSLDDVAASLGVSKPTIYHYLGNKENVLSECLRIGLKQLLQAASDARATSGNAAQRLHRFLVGYAKVNLSEFGRCVIRTPDEALGAENLESLLTLKRRVHAAMCDFLKEGMSDGSIAPCDANLMAFTLAGALNWPARWYDPDAGHDPYKTVDAMVENLATGFLPR